MIAHTYDVARRFLHTQRDVIEIFQDPTVRELAPLDGLRDTTAVSETACISHRKRVLADI